MTSQFAEEVLLQGLSSAPFSVVALAFVWHETREGTSADLLETEAPSVHVPSFRAAKCVERSGLILQVTAISP